MNGAAIRAGLPWFTLVLLGLVLGSWVLVGADTLWAAALGRDVLARRAIPVGVPFAELPSGDWINVPVLGQVVLALAAQASWGLVLMHLMIVLGTLATVAHQARLAGAESWAVGVILLLVVLATLSAVVIVRMPVLSLLPWVIVVGLTRSCMHFGVTRSRATGILLTMILWANLHGGVLVGVLLLLVAGAVALIAVPRNPRMAALSLFAAGCVLIVTPAGVDTWRYYVGALTNEAARSGTQMWAPPTPGNPLDVIMLASLAGLSLTFARARPPIWEIIVALGMAVATLSSARHGVWLALFLACGASAGLKQTERAAAPSLARAFLAACLATAAGMLMVGQRQGPILASQDVAASIGAVVGHRPVLAPEPLAETLAFTGVRTVIGNPLDAFAAGDQRDYLDFVNGVKLVDRLLVPHVIIAAPHDSASARLAAGDGRLAPIGTVDGVRLWTVSTGGTGE